MSITLPTLDLAGTTVGSTGSLDLTRAVGQGGVSYAAFGQATLRLHNESNCGLQCSLPVSGQSFYLPAGGWQDCYPKGGDNALDYEILYTLSGPGVTLLLATYFYPGDQVPPVTQLGNSPIGGGNVSTNFSELINTGNNPLSTLINVQPNDAASPTWSADNSGNLSISSDNAGVLTTLLQLVAGASPEVIIGAASILTDVLGMLHVEHTLTANGGINVSTIRDDTVGSPQIALSNVSPQVTIANNLQVNGTLTKAALATSTASLSTGGTIATTTPIAKPTPGSAVAGIILQPGTVDGQVMAIINLGLAGASITFAPSSTSHVEDGTSDVIASGNAALFLWEGTNARWYRIYPN